MDLTHYNWLFKKQWYLQSFNGVPLLITHGGVSAAQTMDKTLGYGYGPIIMLFENDLGEMYYPLDGLQQVYKEFMKCSTSQKNYLDRCIQQADREMKSVLTVIDRIKQCDLKELSTTALLELFKQMNDAYPLTVATSHCIEGYALCSESEIATLLMEVLKQRHEEKKFAYYLTLLTAPDERSLVAEEEEELYALIQQIRETDSWYELLNHTTQQIMAHLGEYPALKKRLQQHQEKYFWIAVTYASGILADIPYFIEKIKRLLEEDKKGEVAPVSPDKKRACIRDLGITGTLYDHLKLTSRMTSWQDIRKKHMLTGVVYIDCLLTEIAQRFNLDLNLLHYTLPEEFTEEQLERFTTRDLEERRKGCAVVYTKEKTELLIGETYQQFKMRFKKDDQQKKVMEFTGMCACIGKVVGRVRMCRTLKEIATFKEGDILVTGMTRPEFVPAMKKAIAIVTDEGGITSHAAIVARELGTPCVIGTKIATKVLNNGDLVEVAAHHGRVRIIERASISNS